MVLTADADPVIGSAAGQHIIQERLGGGGMGVVYRALHIGLQQQRAIKLLRPELAENEGFVSLFMREAQLAAQLRHPNIVTIHDVARQDRMLYLAMELLAGQSLHALIVAGASLPPTRVLGLLRQLARALDFAHARGVVHRDVKPDNVVVGPDDHVTLVDFGIARVLDADFRVTRLVGTPAYMAPETLLGQPIGPSTDLYALGVVAYQLLAGRTPFAGLDTPALLFAAIHTPPPSPRSFRQGMPLAVEQVLLRQLAKEPASRFASAEAFVTALSAAHGVAPSAAWTAKPTMPSDRWHSQPATPAPGQTGPGGQSSVSPAGVIEAPSRGQTGGVMTPSPLRVSQSVSTGQAQSGRGSLPLPPCTSEVQPPRQAYTRNRGRARWFVALGLFGATVVGGVVASQTHLIVPQVRAATVGAASTPGATPATSVQPPSVVEATATAPALPSVVAPRATAVPPTPTPSPQQRLDAARAALDGRDYRQAVQLLTALRSTHPSTPGLADLLYQAHLGAGQALLAAGDKESSWEEYGKALALRPDDPAALEGRKHVTLARHWDQMEAAWSNDDAAAVAALEAILSLDPGYRDAARKLYAKVMSRVDGLLAAGDQRAAFALLQRALQLEPNGQEALKALGAYTAVPVADAHSILLAESFEQPAQSQLIRSSTHPLVASGFLDGEFRLASLIAEIPGQSFLTVPVHSANVSVAVDVRLEGDTADRWISLSCRDGQSTGGYVAMFVPGESMLGGGGLVSLDRRVSGADASGQSSQSGQLKRTTVIRRGNLPNRFELLCQGSAIQAYVNGLLVAETEDSTGHGEGGVSIGGISLALFDEIDWRIDVRLDNLLVIGR